jgi:hypothetical protein
MHFITCSSLFCYGQDLVVTRCNLMTNVKMHFGTCSRFFTVAKIWWPQGVIWMFDLYVFCSFLEIFCCDEQLGGH